MTLPPISARTARARAGALFILVLSTCLGRAAEDWLVSPWPALYRQGAPGAQVLVREIDLRLDSVPTRGEPQPRRARPGLLIGPHLSMTDMPFAQILVLSTAVNDPDGSVSRGLLDALRRTGSNAVRIYEGYWWDPLGAETSARILAHHGHVAAEKTERFAENWGYPDGREVMEYFARNGFDVVMVVSTIYLDQETKQVYTTRQVADNADGILDKAAERNGATLARWWTECGRDRRLILELGNEGIGYSRDSSPTLEQYSRIVNAFEQAIRRAGPDVEIALVMEPLETVNENPGYQYGTGMRAFLARCADTAPLIDHAVVHLYDRHSRDYSLTFPGDVSRLFELVTADLDANGFEHAKLLVTEYAFDLWSANRDTVGHAVALATRQISMAGHPRVSGLFVHNTPGTQLFSYSDGKAWTLSPPGSLLHRGTPSRHYRDSRGDELGPRFRMLPTGPIQALLATALRGQVVDAYAMDRFGQFAILISRDDTIRRFLVVNTQPVPLALQLPELRAATVRTFRGQAWDAVPVDGLTQPYGLHRETAPHLQTWKVLAFAVALIEGEAGP